MACSELACSVSSLMPFDRLPPFPLCQFPFHHCYAAAASELGTAMYSTSSLAGRTLHNHVNQDAETLGSPSQVPRTQVHSCEQL